MKCEFGESYPLYQHPVILSCQLTLFSHTLEVSLTCWDVSFHPAYPRLYLRQSKPTLSKFFNRSRMRPCTSSCFMPPPEA